jgi:hypothetical protein
LNLKNFAVCSLLILVATLWLPAQTVDRERPESNYDELVAYLKLSDAQVACLKANQNAFRNAVSADMQKLQDLQKQLREASRSGADTAALRSQIEAVRASIQATRNSHVTTAQSCVGGAAAVNDLVAAETLMNEVRQAIGLLLIQPTETGLAGPRGRARGR